MPLDGNGIWVPAGSSVNPAVNATTISETDWNTLLADLKTALSTAIFKDGQATLTANIPMGGFKLTGLAAGSASGNSVRYEQLSMDFLASGTASASATLDFTNLSNYSAILFVLEHVLPTTNAVNLHVRVSIDNGANYIASGYDYALWVVNAAGATGAQSSTGANQMLASANPLGNSSNVGANGTVLATGLDSATAAKYFNIDTSYGSSTPSNERAIGTGVNSTTSAINAVRFLMSSGSIASGTIRAFGIRKA